MATPQDIDRQRYGNLGTHEWSFNYQTGLSEWDEQVCRLAQNESGTYTGLEVRGSFTSNPRAQAVLFIRSAAQPPGARTAWDPSRGYRWYAA